MYTSMYENTKRVDEKMMCKEGCKFWSEEEDGCTFPTPIPSEDFAIEDGEVIGCEKGR